MAEEENLAEESLEEEFAEKTVSSKIKYQRPRGMVDILPSKFENFDKVFQACSKTAESYGFSRIETPVLEMVELFSKGVGAGTDIVEKEMYVIKGEKGVDLALRPEGTAPVARAYIENGLGNLPKPVKLWYFSQFFRRERPQSGRLRQFWQFGMEVFGRRNPIIEAQLVQVALAIFKKLGISKLSVEINSLGCLRCRARYHRHLSTFLKHNRNGLCVDCKVRMKKNLLRVLDCKSEKCQHILSQAPQTADILCKKCRAHFRETLELLDGLSAPYRLNPFLVRGLDYYTRTVFEIFSEDNPQGNSLALAGGGRYDELVKSLGGSFTPACGIAIGVERVMGLMKTGKKGGEESCKPDVFLAQLGELAKKRALNLFEDLRKADILVAEGFSSDSLRAQLSRAGRMGMRYVLIFGQNEALEDQIILRDMEKRSQTTLKLEGLADKIKAILKEKN